MRNAWLPRTLILLLALATLFVACAPQSTARTDSPAADAARTVQPKRITAVIMGEPPTLSTKVNTSGAGGVVPGADAVEELVNAGLARLDPQGNLHPQLAEAVPSLDNGLWKLLPNGGMETVWRLKPDVRWHDGRPVTTDDLLFATRVGEDPELPAFSHLGFSALESVTAMDSRTAIVRWRQPYIGADTMFTAVFPPFALPLPAHVLEATYRENKAGFLDHPYWNQAFVGTGPYRLREWQQGSHLVLAANQAYALGRPKIDEIEVRFILDSNVLATNLLAGTVELTLGRTLSLEQAFQVRDQWSDGSVENTLRSWIVIYPQMMNASPVVVGDVRFRRALLHAIDRQQLVDTLQAGQVPVAHSYVSPAMAEYRVVEDQIVRYEYDPGRATQVIEALGYAKAPDGFFRDAAGQRLSVELRTTADNDIHRATVFPIADAWQRVGVGVEPNVIPVQRQRDREYRANSPAFEMLQQGNDLPSLATHHSREIPVADNNYVGRSKHRYQNAEFDALIDGYFSTIARPERMRVLGQLMHKITDELTIMGLFYLASPTLVRNRILNVGAGGDRATQAWNAHEWDVR
jgi:peptide/nickel transport system substrate-binding protein